jgi:predicted dehydrogenase
MRSRTVWQRHVNEMDGFELVGVHDIAQESLDKAVELGGITPEQGYTDLPEMLSATTPDVLIACPETLVISWPRT